MNSYLLRLGLCLGLSLTKVASADSHLTGVNLQMCDDSQAHCLQIRSQEAEVSTDAEIFALQNPVVTGQGFDNKTFSSAYVDFKSKRILLREKNNGRFLGEWSVDLDRNAVHFYGRL